MAWDATGDDDRSSRPETYQSPSLGKANSENDERNGNTNYVGITWHVNWTLLAKRRCWNGNRTDGYCLHEFGA